ncbi:MAG: tetratricopeptide repeat protein [Hydrogenophaga sp.]|nr:tetratricopeptide repeat protein [Hydrogenophaga sp.]
MSTSMISLHSSTGSLHSLRRLPVAAALVAALWTPIAAFAQTDAYAEINRLLRAGQISEALGKVDQHLAAKPNDPQMRFLKGVVQTESGKTADAVATFTKLTEDYPELPEPYNNLAVLYASQSQFDKARAALEMAIRTNPSYATAHENLGDVYAKLASQAYSKALQLDAAQTGAAPKLNLIRSLFATGGQPAAAAPAPVSVAKAPASAPPANEAPAAAEASKAPAPSAAAEAPKTPAPSTPATATPPVADNASEAVKAAVASWARAWSSKDMQAYLGAYAPEFTPTGGQSRRSWESSRRARIEPRKNIQVSINNLTVKVEGDQASARFHQTYRSDQINVSSRKVLDMVRHGERWLIVRESTGS